MSVSGPDHEDEKRDRLYPRTRARGRVQPADCFWRVVPCAHLPRAFSNLFSTCHQPGEKERANEKKKYENWKETERYRDWHEETASTAKVALNQSITKNLNKDQVTVRKRCFWSCQREEWIRDHVFTESGCFSLSFCLVNETEWYLEYCCAVFGSFDISESLCCGSLCSVNGSLSVCQCPVSAVWRSRESVRHASNLQKLCRRIYNINYCSEVWGC